MKMIAINGSPHAKGEVWKLLRSVQTKSPQLRLINLKRSNISFVAKAVKSADLIVMATPVRWFNVSALMKELLEKLEEGPDYPLQDKIAYLVAVGDEDGGQQAINQMFAPLSHMGFWFPPYASQFINTNMKGKSEANWQDKIPETIADELQRLAVAFEVIRNVVS